MYRILGLVLALVLAPACVHAPPQLSPEGKTGFHIRRVLVGIDTLQTTAIDAEEAGLISEDDARAVVKATITAAKTARTLALALQAGYTEADTQRKLLRALRQVLQELPGQLSPRAHDMLSPYLQTVISLLVIYGY